MEQAIGSKIADYLIKTGKSKPDPVVAKKTWRIKD